MELRVLLTCVNAACLLAACGAEQTKQSRTTTDQVALRDSVPISDSGSTTDTTPPVRTGAPSEAGSFTVTTDSDLPILQPQRRIRISESELSTQVETLRLRRRFGDTLTWNRPWTLSSVGDHVVIGDVSNVIVIDLETGKIAKRIDRIGMGPGEFIDPGWFTRVSDYPPKVWVYQSRQRRFSLLDLQLPTESMIVDEFRLDLPHQIRHPVFTESGIITNGFFLDFTLLNADMDGNVVSRIRTELPFGEERAPSMPMLLSLNVSMMATHPSGDQLVLAYVNSNRIDFFTTEGQFVSSIIGPRATVESPARPGGFAPDHEVAYMGLDATSKFVYALFCGCTNEERDRRLKPNLLHVYRWDGEFVAELRFDRPVIDIAVSSDDSLLFAAFEDPYPWVGEWVLPSVLR